MIEAHPQSQPGAELLSQPQQCLLHPRPLHRLHGIGQHQHIEATLQRRLDHRQRVAVHERLTAGKADFARAQSQFADFVVQRQGIAERKILEPVVARRRLDIAIGACDVAQRAGVDPKGRKPAQADLGPRLAAGRDNRVAELFRVKRLERRDNIAWLLIHRPDTTRFARSGKPQSGWSRQV